MEHKKPTIAFVAAGSGGHIQSALAVIESIHSQYPTRKDEILFVGSNLLMEGEKNKQPLEEQLANRMGVPFYQVRTSKLQRQFSLSNILALWKLSLGFLDALKIINKQNVRKVICFGGYNSLPMGVVAWLKNIPLYIHEQTTSIGLTNRILRFLAKKSLISYQESLPFFTKTKEVIHTGSPSRNYLFSVDSVGALQKKLASGVISKFEDTYLHQLEKIEKNQNRMPFILVMGGSQGSHLINTIMKNIIGRLAEKHILFIQTGDYQVTKDFGMLADYVATLPDAIQKNIIVRKFIFEELGILYKNADLLIARSGANSVYEAGMMKLKSIFIPIPWVTKNEQYTNARILEDIGIAKVIEEKSVTQDVLAASIINMLKKEISMETIKVLDEKFPRDAAERIGEIVMKE